MRNDRNQYKCVKDCLPSLSTASDNADVDVTVGSTVSRGRGSVCVVIGKSDVLADGVVGHD